MPQFYRTHLIFVGVACALRLQTLRVCKRREMMRYDHPPQI